MKYEVPIDLGEATGGRHVVFVEVDVVALALRYARRAHKNKSKRVKLAHGAVTVRIRPDTLLAKIIDTPPPASDIRKRRMMQR